MEMDRNPTLTDLLAHRDGELDDVELAARIDGDSAARAELARLSRMKAELASLPPVNPDPAVWQAIQERTGGHRPGWLQRFPLATAASVFVAAALTIVLWNPASTPVDVGGPRVSDPVAELMLRSQHLESELFTRAGASTIGTTSEEAMLYAIAEVDVQLNELYASDSPDAAERERLWRQRVMLLESLADVQRGQAVLRPAIY